MEKESEDRSEAGAGEARQGGRQPGEKVEGRERGSPGEEGGERGGRGKTCKRQE